MIKISILGAGAFGTALATLLASRCGEVLVWGRDLKMMEAWNRTRENPRALPGCRLPPEARATADLDELFGDHSLHSRPGLVLCALPSHAVRTVFQGLDARIPGEVPILSVTKGIENDSLKTTVEVLEECLPSHRASLAALSGPSFAQELAQGMPTVVTVASREVSVALRCQQILQSETLRLYTTTDVVGVELGGALKNVIAIAAGISEGLGFGSNARAALITRGLAEINRIAVKRGAHPLTLAGLSGLGDLVLTCTGELSRNRRVGLELGRGRKLEKILSELGHVAEGVRTAKAACDLARTVGVELPICEQVYRIAYEGKEPRAAVVELMTRQPRAEL